jgi:RNA polymerase sigma-70 factor, ECF subfamily
MLLSMAALLDYSRLTDEELACRGSESAAFVELHRRLHPRLCGFLLTLVANPDIVDDLAQDTWRKAWPTIRSGKFSGCFRAWLFRIARKAAEDWRRQKKASLLTDEQTAGVPDRPNPAESVALSEHAARLEKCLERLAPRHSEVIRLRSQGLAPRAIAEKIGLPAERVQRIAFDALQLLRLCVGVTGP